MNFKVDSHFFNLINMHLCIASLSVTAQLQYIHSIVQQQVPYWQRRDWMAALVWDFKLRAPAYMCVCVCVCVCVRMYMSMCCVSTPHRNSVPPPLCVIVVMSADCRLLWCLHLSSIWPMLGIWPGLIVLMVTPASCPREGRPNSSPDIMKEM